jgi:DNA-binding IclR family transcriptional regulator
MGYSSTWCYEVLTTPERRDARVADLLAALARSFHPLTTRELQDIVRGPQSDVKRYLDVLARKGQVTKISAGSAYPCLWELKVSVDALRRRGIVQ